MTERTIFRQLMRERRHFPAGSSEHAWRTRACRKYVWQLRKVPTCNWSKMEAHYV